MHINIDIGYNKNQVMHENINIACNKGDIINIVGENGSGKSTFYKTLIGDIPPIRGEVSTEIKSNIATISDYINIPKELYVSDVLDFLGEKSIENIKIKYHEILKIVMDYKHQKVKALSSGQRRILEIFSVLTSGKSIIVLDEACNTLDLKNRDMFLEQVKKLAESGVIIFNTSHNLEDVIYLGGTIHVLSKDKKKFFTYNDDLSVEKLSIFIKQH